MIATAISSGRILQPVAIQDNLSISRLINDLETDPVGRVVTEFDLDILERFLKKISLGGWGIFIPDRPSTITVLVKFHSTSFTFNHLQC